MSALKNSRFVSRLFTQIRSCSCKPEPKKYLVRKAEIQRFIVDSLVAAGATKENANCVAIVLSAADEKGHHSHGISRLGLYIRDLKKCLVDGKACPKIAKETKAIAWVDGNKALGAVVGYFCTNLAIKKAKDIGVGWVVANKTAHYGICSAYTIAMLKEGLVGLSFTNTSPLMAPHGAKQAALGTNPISLAAPAADCDRFVFDVATTAVAKGKIEVALREGKKIPKGWVQDSDGKPITDPEEALECGSMLPLGGYEEGVKGTGLAMMVDVLCGVLAGGNYGPRVPRWGKAEESSNLGQCFIAVNPNCFAPCFEERMGDFLKLIRCLEPVDPCKPVMVPGDPEAKLKKKWEKAGGIEYSEVELKALCKIAQELCVDPVKVKDDSC